MIKTIHIIWVGDESKRPEACIASWREMNPTWEIKIWGNKELLENKWINAEKIKEMFPRELNGVADIMRYEILFNFGGFVVDADSFCVRSLDDHLFEPSLFLCYENEIARPGLIAAGYFYSMPRNLFVSTLIQKIYNTTSVTSHKAWITVGPQLITNTHNEKKHSDITIYPSHYFLPVHYTGIKYTGTGQIYAKQFWGSTGGDRYDRLNKINPGTEDSIGNFYK